MSRTERTELLIGTEGVKKLERSGVLVFGVGGVGGFVIEALARAGLGRIAIVDGDTVSESNINRQIIATDATVGKMKAEVMKERILSINPECKAEAYGFFYLPGEKSAECFRFEEYDYVVDAVDMVAAKIDIIDRSRTAGVPVISSMGTGNKLDPSRFEIAPIEKTSVCPLARVVRRELRRRGIEGVDVLYSKEEPVKTGSSVPGSISFVPSTAGLLIAGHVVNRILNGEARV
ncbi:MAG: ThiF family adenylyltransferase [Anaerovoracaceae bacterium]